MKKVMWAIIICILCTLIFFTFGCQANRGLETNIKNPIADEKNENTANEQQAFTFIPQEIRPIEDNPFIFPVGITSESGLHSLSVKRPQIDENTDADDVINAILSMPNQVADIKSKDLIDHIYFETGDQPIFKLLSEKDEYLRASVRKQDGTGQDERQDLWGDLYLDAINYYALEMGGMDDSSNCAVLIKYRNSGVGGGGIGFSNSNIGTTLEIDNRSQIHLGSNDDQNQIEYFVENIDKEYANQFQLMEKEWYYALIAMDEYAGYRFIIWQQNDPINNAFYACDLSDIFKIDESRQGHQIWTDINFYSQSDEISFDIATIKVYEFENFADIANEELDNNIIEYQYADDYEKYKLAVDLFYQEDYYNAYLILNELNGYDTSATYLAECERMLRTVEINDPNVAGAIKKAMKDCGMDIYDCLYTYQAEKIENLDLASCNVQDLNFLESFQNLKELKLDNNGISELMPLKDLYSLRYLSLSRNNITDILPLYNLTGLEYLDLSKNIIEDVSPLGNLGALKELDLSINNIHTIAGLYSLKNLEKVDLSYNFINSVNALNGSDIKELNIMNTKISNLSAVTNFSNLESLTAGFKLAHIIIAGCPMEQQAIFSKYQYGDGSVWAENLYGLEYIQGLENLKYLELARLELGEDEDELLPLTTLPSLEVLKFYKYNGPSGVETLGKLTGLTELAVDTWERGIFDLSFLPKLTKLKKFEGPIVPTLPLVAQLKNLEELRIGGYIEESLDFISELKNLKLLTIGGEPPIEILDFSFLRELENLEYLDIALQNPPWQRNKPGFTQKNVEKAFELEALEYLNIDMWQKHLETIEGLQNLQNLKYLSLNFATCNDSRIADQSIFMDFDNMQAMGMHIAEGDNSCGYYLGIGYAEETKSLKKPGIGELAYPNLWNVDIYDGNQYEYFMQDNFNRSQNLKFELWIKPSDYKDKAFTLKVPKGVRNLFIFNTNQERINLNIDATECYGLEWIAVGELPMESASEFPGYGNKFIIDNLDGLSDCVNLRYIFMEDAEISDISGLADCDQLEVLQLDMNMITDISALEGKEHLRELYMNFNNIENISVLESCIRLKR